MSKNAPSRSAESRRERRVIRDWFAAAVLYVAALDELLTLDKNLGDYDAFQEIIADFERADALLATVDGYAGSSFVED